MRACAVRMIIEWRLPALQARSVSDALHALSAASAPRASLLRCWFPRGPADPVMLRYTTHWPSEERLREHIIAGQLAQVAELVERAGTQASIVFEKSDAVHGIEYIETLLHGNQAGSSAPSPRILSAHGRWR